MPNDETTEWGWKISITSIFMCYGESQYRRIQRMDLKL